jgi:2-succinyl-6-hydroxy-2,4-cyclohexadiene-1-carboxylate synthase
MIGLSYTVSGAPHRPAILFLHGFMGSGADWAGTISALDERFYCVAPDLPGHGRFLGLTSQVYTNKGAAKMLRELLDGLEISRAALAGYSMGGGSRCTSRCATRSGTPDSFWSPPRQG